MTTLNRQARKCAGLLIAIILIFTFALAGANCIAQTADLRASASGDSSSRDTSSKSADANDSTSKKASTPLASDPDISPAVAKQLAALQAEIEELKALLKSRIAAQKLHRLRPQRQPLLWAPNSIIAPHRDHSRDAKCKTGGSLCQTPPSALDAQRSR